MRKNCTITQKIRKSARLQAGRAMPLKIWLCVRFGVDIMTVMINPEESRKSRALPTVIPRKVWM